MISLRLLVWRERLTPSHSTVAPLLLLLGKLVSRCYVVIICALTSSLSAHHCHKFTLSGVTHTTNLDLTAVNP
ncbi:hypothetical protein FJQ87_13390 [Shewanella sp. SNU WT4]|nr:hypothetical protein FJQ87_13390 [Shewanella sp. SNU WT4]